MSFGSQLSSIFGGFTKGLYQGLFGTDTVKDYKHASKTFLSDGYSLAPQSKFLYHVYFNLNTAQISGLRNTMGSAKDLSQLGMMVKTAELPSYSMEVDTLNQYNRKRYVQQKINYRPVSISFHDDGSDLIRSMWYNYYTYYFSDARHSYDGISTGNSTGNLSNGPFDFNRRDIYDDLRSIHDWGYNAESETGGYKPNFFRDIRIYGLNRGNFVEYTLINPIITDWNHDTFDYADGGGTMTNRMTLQYETVKYRRGKIGTPGDSEVRGWGDDANYDSSPSKLSQGGSTTSIFGQGGLLDAGSSVISDLQNGNPLGAILTAGRSYETFKNADLGSILAEEGVQQIVTQGTILAQNQTVQNSVSNFIFSKPDTSLTGTTPLGSSTTQSNGGFTSATNWKNPNLTAQPVNTRTLQTYNIPTDVQSNGTTANWLPENYFSDEDLGIGGPRNLPPITSPR